MEAPIGLMLFLAGKKKLHDVLDTMNCNNSTTVGGSFRIYDKAHMPLRFHYTNNKRIGDVVVETDAGYQLTTCTQSQDTYIIQQITLISI